MTEHQGLNDPYKVTAVKQLLRDYAVDVVAILETKVKIGYRPTIALRI